MEKAACAPQNLRPYVRARRSMQRAEALARAARVLIGSAGLTSSSRRRLQAVAAAADKPRSPASAAATWRVEGRRLEATVRGGGSGRGGRGSRGWRAHGSQLQAWVHVADLREDGALALPAHRHLVLEIGANTRNTLDRELLPYEPTAFLITFEPLLDKYASLLSRNSRPDTLTPLGRHHPRALALPFAVSADANALREFKISGATDGCASLLDPVSSYYSPSCTNVSGVLERRAVPSVSLEHVLTSWLAGQPVHLAKVDAQGL